MLNLSIVIDTAMICVLLWSFHLQYEQAAGLYLKAPSAMYLFIFVALRALRYDPRYVIFAGVGAAVGWTVLTILAIRGDSGVARDFVGYMTSTQVLVGAQVVSRILDADKGFQPGEGEVQTAVTMMIAPPGFSRWAEGISPSEVRRPPVPKRHRESGSDRSDRSLK